MVSRRLQGEGSRVLGAGSEHLEVARDETCAKPDTSYTVRSRRNEPYRGMRRSTTRLGPPPQVVQESPPSPAEELGLLLHPHHPPSQPGKADICKCGSS